MRIAIASDHAGFDLKQDLAAFVREIGHQVLDLGPRNRRPVDYPDFAAAVGEAVREPPPAGAAGADGSSRGARDARTARRRRAARPGDGPRADRGILICGSGVGASIAANKLPGVRAGLCHDTYSAHQGVEHDDMNVLVLGARVIGVELARDLVRAFLTARFSKAPRHERRLAKIRALERSGQM